MPVVIDQVEMVPEEPGRSVQGAEPAPSSPALNESLVAEIVGSAGERRRSRDLRRWAH